MADENIPCPGVALTIGAKSSVHYQSLLPLEVKVNKIKVKARLPANTIDLAAAKINDHFNLNTNSREEFPDLGPPNGKRKAQPEDKSLRRAMPLNSRQSIQSD